MQKYGNPYAGIGAQEKGNVIYPVTQIKQAALTFCSWLSFFLY